MDSSAKQNNSDDYEARFYAVLASALDSKVPSVDDVKRDFFDATLGTQVGLDSTGNPVLMWVLKPESVKLIMDAAKYHQDHECQEGVHMGLYVLYTLAAQLTHIFPYLPDAIKTWEPYKH